MSTVRRIAKNTLVLLFANIIGLILGLLYIMYTARYLGVKNFGILSFAIAFIGLFEIFASLGLQGLIVREVARDKKLAGKYLGNAVIIKTFLIIITFSIIAVTINLLGYPEQTIKVVYLITFSVIFNSFSKLFYSIFQAFEKMEYQSIGSILNSIFLFIGALIAISQRFNIIGFALIYFLTSLIVLGYSFVICIWKFTRFKIEIDWGFWKSTLKMTLPFSITFFMVGMFLQLDIVMLSAMKGDDFAGWYKAAVTLILIIIATSATFIFAIFPVLSKLFVSAKDTLIMTLEKSSKYLFILVLPIAVVMYLLADRIILFIYGAEFASAAIVLQIHSLYLPIRVISIVTGKTLGSINREPLRALSFGIAISVNICLNIILIPSFGIVGASISTLLSQILLFTLFFYFIAKHLHRIPLHKIAIKPCLSSLVMALFLLTFPGGNLFLLIILSIGIYFTVLWILRTFDSDDKKILRDLLKPINQVLLKTKEKV